MVKWSNNSFNFYLSSSMCAMMRLIINIDLLEQLFFNDVCSSVEFRSVLSWFVSPEPNFGGLTLVCVSGEHFQSRFSYFVSLEPNLKDIGLCFCF